MSQSPTIIAVHSNADARPVVEDWSLDRLAEGLGSVRLLADIGLHLVLGQRCTRSHLYLRGWDTELWCLPEHRHGLRAALRTATASGSVDAQAIMAQPARERAKMAEQSRDPDLLELLAADRRSRHVRLAVASNRFAGQDELALLAGDEDDAVRRAVAKHLSLPSAVMERLCQDEDEMVRWWLARRRDLPDSCVMTLAGDEAPRVTRELVQRRQLPADAVRRMLHHSRPRAVIDAAGRNEVPLEERQAALRALHIADLAYSDAYELARQKATPEDVLRELVRAHPNSSVGQTAEYALRCRAEGKG